MKTGKVVLNTFIILSEILVARFLFGVLSDKIDPDKGIALVVVSSLVTVLLVQVAQDPQFRWVRPGLLKTTTLAIGLLAIAFFLGIDPVTYGW
jgi:nitrate/nitrite transporter NarK